jgi:amidase
MLVKDQAETKGIVTTYGSIIEGPCAIEDVTVAKKLRDAVAIILAKSTMPDWATGWFSTSSISGRLS